MGARRAISVRLRPRPRCASPAAFHVYATAAALTTAGLFTFGLFGFHLSHARLVTVAAVPFVYAGAMAVGAVVALVAGHAFDQWGARTLLVLPLLVAIVPALAFSHKLTIALAGIAVWGAASGLQDSTVKALVAELAPSRTLATAYGVFAAYQGAGALIGGAVGGALYANHRTALVVGTALAMLLAYGP